MFILKPGSSGHGMLANRLYPKRCLLKFATIVSCGVEVATVASADMRPTRLLGRFYSIKIEWDAQEARR